MPQTVPAATVTHAPAASHPSLPQAFGFVPVVSFGQVSGSAADVTGAQVPLAPQASHVPHEALSQQRPSTQNVPATHSAVIRQ